jgi:hypothetical protein
MSYPKGIKTELVPDDSHAVLQLKTNGNIAVNFSLVDAAGGKIGLGSVFDLPETVQAQLLPFVVRMVKAGNRFAKGSLPVREVLVDTTAPVKVAGESKWADTTGSKHTGYSTHFGSCGPLYSSFRPEPLKRYVVRFSFIGDGCVQQVFDVTAADAILVSGRDIPTIPK